MYIYIYIYIYIHTTTLKRGRCNRPHIDTHDTEVYVCIPTPRCSRMCLYAADCNDPSMWQRPLYVAVYRHIRHPADCNDPSMWQRPLYVAAYSHIRHPADDNDSIPTPRCRYTYMCVYMQPTAPTPPPPRHHKRLMCIYESAMLGCGCGGGVGAPHRHPKRLMSIYESA